MLSRGLQKLKFIIPRFCSFWPDIIETEQRFLMVCMSFELFRAELLETIGGIIPYFNQLPEYEQFIIRLCHEQTLIYPEI